MKMYGKGIKSFEGQGQKEYQSSSYTSEKASISPDKFSRTAGQSMVKTAFFHTDNQMNDLTVRMAINRYHYRNLDALLDNLTEKMPTLRSGARAIYTPRGHTRISSLNDLQNNGHYICSSRFNRPIDKRADLSKYYDVSTSYRSNRFERFQNRKPYSRITTLGQYENRESLNLLNSNSSRTLDFLGIPETYTARRYVSMEHLPTSSAIQSNKKSLTRRIHVYLNGNPHTRKTVLIRQNRMQQLGSVLQELSELFKIPIRKVYTTEGSIVSYSNGVSLLKG